MFQLFGLKKKKVKFTNVNSKVNRYVTDITNAIRDHSSSNVIVVLVYEDKNITNKIVNKLSDNGYKVTMNKYNEGYELGVFFWLNS